MVEASISKYPVYPYSWKPIECIYCKKQFKNIYARWPKLEGPSSGICPSCSNKKVIADHTKGDKIS